MLIFVKNCVKQKKEAVLNIPTTKLEMEILLVTLEVSLFWKQ